MTYPKELWEDTVLEHADYPFQLFENRCASAKTGDCILYLHWHEHFEFLVMQTGNAVFHVDSRPYVVQQGDIILIPAGSLHVGYSLVDGDVNYDCIVLNASLFNDWLSDPVHTQYVAPYLEGRFQFPVKPADQDETCKSYYSLLDEIIQEFSVKAPAYQLVVKSKLHLFFTLMSRSFMPQQFTEQGEPAYFPNRERFKQLIRRIELSYADKVTVEQAAKEVNLNPYYFCKLFKRLTGRTFVEYVNIFRMKEAKRLLMESNDSITEIAARVGCENPNYFTRIYKKYMGMTPSQTRKRDMTE